MRVSLHFFELVMVLLQAAFPSPSAQNNVATDPQVQLTLDNSEARQALVILHKEQAHKSVEDDDWQKLFATIPYQWLKARETGLRRGFTDESFRKFMQAPETQGRAEEWEQTLAGMERANMAGLGQRVLAWLPAGAVIQARVFPLIKPMTNSFVWRNEHDEPAIFIYLEKQTQAQFETIVTHECHHIGLFGLETQQEKMFAELPTTVKTAAELMGAFGEGEAVLAAIGSTDLRPHWEDDAPTRARWDSDMMHFNQDLVSLTQFFDDVLNGKLKGDAIQEKASTFFGYQGPWYTVGYEMAALVEKRFGRKVFTDCLLDPRLLLLRYNEVATEANKNGASLALWPEDLLRRIYVDHLPPALP
ncbi:MAG: DUF5700 domain-containing putative Zn-dependent protease [Candidatus Acidiferrum sp.]